MDMTFEEWLEYGRRKGWIKDGHCDTHDMVPWTEEEQTQFAHGADPCIPVLRVYPPG